MTSAASAARCADVSGPAPPPDAQRRSTRVSTARGSAASAVQWKELHPGDDPEGAWLRDRVIAVRDAGFTEVDPGTITVLAQWAPEQAAS